MELSEWWMCNEIKVKTFSFASENESERRKERRAHKKIKNWS